MGSSVQATGASNVFVGKLATALVTVTSDFWLGGWFRVNSYATTFTQVFTLFKAGGGGANIGCDTAETTSDTLDVYVGGTGFTNAHVAVASGNFTGWIWIAVTHVGGTANYKVYWRREYESGLSTTTLSTGIEMTMPTQDFVLLGDSSDASATNGRAVHVAQVAPTAAQLLAISRTLNPPASQAVYLPLLSAATAGTNSGTAGAFSVTGSLADSAAEPLVFPSGYAPNAVIPGLFNRRIPPFWPPARELALSTAPAVGSNALAATIAGTGGLTGTLTAPATTATQGLQAPSPPLFGEFNRFIPPFWPPARELALSTAAMAAVLAATLTGVGGLSGAGTAVGALTATIAGSGATSATATGQGTLSASLAGVGALTGTGSAAGALSSTLAGTGALTGTASASGALSATCAGVGTLTGTAGAPGSISSTLAGAGALSGTATAPGALAASCAGVGGVTATLTAPGALGGTCAGIGALSGASSAKGALAGTGAGVGALTATASANGALAGTAAGEGALSGTVIQPGNNATLAGVGGLTGTTSAIASVTATCAGTGGLSCTASALGTLSGSAAGVGGVTATAGARGALSSTFGGVGGLTATAAATGALTATAAGVGSLSGTMALGGMAATCAGSSSLSGSCTARGALAANLAGSGGLTGTFSQPGVATATCAGAGSLSGVLGTGIVFTIAALPDRTAPIDATGANNVAPPIKAF